MKADKEKEMRRLGAAGIDFVITYIFSAVVYCIMISCCFLYPTYLPMLFILFSLIVYFKEIHLGKE